MSGAALRAIQQLRVDRDDALREALKEIGDLDTKLAAAEARAAAVRGCLKSENAQSLSSPLSSLSPAHRAVSMLPLNGTQVVNSVLKVSKVSPIAASKSLKSTTTSSTSPHLSFKSPPSTSLMTAAKIPCPISTDYSSPNNSFVRVNAYRPSKSDAARLIEIEKLLSELNIERVKNSGGILER